MVLVSAKANTFQEAQQMSAFIVLPVILLLFGLIGGLFILNEMVLIVMGAVIFLIDLILMKKSTQGFTPEKLL
jgi:membrane-bound ClpP family serine protease